MSTMVVMTTTMSGHGDEGDDYAGHGDGLGGDCADVYESGDKAGGDGEGGGPKPGQYVGGPEGEVRAPQTADDRRTTAQKVSGKSGGDEPPRHQGRRNKMRRTTKQMRLDTRRHSSRVNSMMPLPRPNETARECRAGMSACKNDAAFATVLNRARTRACEDSCLR